MKPRTILELARMHDDEVRALLAELCGINETEQEGTRHDWLSLESTPILVESEWAEDEYGAGYVAIGAFVNGAWVDAQEVFPNHCTEWSAEVQRIADREREDARVQEAA